MLIFARFAKLTKLQAVSATLTGVGMLSPWIAINALVGGHASLQPTSTLLGIAGKAALDNRAYVLSEQLLAASVASHLGDTSHDKGFAYFVGRLSDVKFALSKDREATAVHLKQFEIIKAVDGEASHSATLHAIFAAENLNTIGESVKARLIAERASLFIRPGHKQYAYMQGLLARIYCDLGQYREAETCANIVLTKAISQRYRYCPVEAFAILACTKAKRGRFAESWSLYKRLQETERSFRQDSQYTDVCLCLIGEKAGIHQNSNEEEQRYVSIAKKMIVRKQQFAECFARNVGSLCLTRGNLKDAEELLHFGVEGAKREYGEDAPITLFAQHKLAELYLKQGRLEEAENLAEQTLQRRSTILGANNVETSNTCQLLGEIKEAGGKSSDALSHYEKAFQIRSQQLGASEPVTLVSSACFAKLWAQRSKTN